MVLLGCCDFVIERGCGDVDVGCGVVWALRGEGRGRGGEGRTGSGMSVCVWVE